MEATIVPIPAASSLRQPRRAAAAAAAALICAACAGPQLTQRGEGDATGVKLPGDPPTHLILAGRTVLDEAERARIGIEGLDTASLQVLAVERLAARGLTLAADPAQATVRIELRAALGTRNRYGQYCGVPAGDFLDAAETAIVRHCDPQAQTGAATSMEPARARLFTGIAGSPMLGAALSIGLDEFAGHLRATPQALPEDFRLAAAMQTVRLRAGSARVIAEMATAHAPAGTPGFGAIVVDTAIPRRDARREALSPEQARQILREAFDALGDALTGRLAGAAAP